MYLCCLLLTACGGPKDHLVGKWELVAEGTPAGAIIEEFTKDGKVIHKDRGNKIGEGSYTLGEDGTLECKYSNGLTLKYKATVTKDDLILRTDDDQVERYKRGR